jgi:hypothetical protein
MDLAHLIFARLDLILSCAHGVGSLCRTLLRLLFLLCNLAELSWASASSNSKKDVVTVPLPKPLGQLGHQDFLWQKNLGVGG